MIQYPRHLHDPRHAFFNYLFIFDEFVELDGRYMNSKPGPRVKRLDLERNNYLSGQVHTIHRALLTKKQAGLIAECYAIARSDAEREANDPWDYVCCTQQEPADDK